MAEATKEIHRSQLGISEEVDLVVARNISDPDTMTLMGAEALGLTAPKKANAKFENLVEERDDEEARLDAQRAKFLDEVEARLTGGTW